ncbi:group II intron maturase-specific domain-containing protein [Spirobacillus cienkowskii]|uniref:group II intron maturase-specific domain-containing protein n=1 Tax=Spirobacillus cienkowskii TaxID=495820 RepID=UPI003BAEF2C9
MSKKSAFNIREVIRHWKLKHWTQSDIREIAEKLNPVISGWLNYYCAHYGSKALQIIAKAVNSHLIKWAKRKFKKNRDSYNKSCEMIKRLHQQYPNLFIHWARCKTIIYNS